MSNDMIQQPHGGALLPGGKPGNAGGGRPGAKTREHAGVIRDLITARFRQALEEGKMVINTVSECAACGAESAPEPVTVTAVWKEMYKLADFVDKWTDDNQAAGEVDLALIKRLSNVVQFAIQQAVDRGELDDGVSVTMLKYIEGTWNEILGEYKVNGAKK